MITIKRSTSNRCLPGFVSIRNNGNQSSSPSSFYLGERLEPGF
jgi:hypothetical protein